MDGLCRVISPAAWVRLSGRLFWCRPLDLNAFACAEQQLLVERRTPVDRAEECLAFALTKGDEATGEVWAEVRKRALATVQKDRDWRVITWDDMFRWLDTRHGLAFSAWYCLGRGARAATEFTDPVKSLTMLRGQAGKEFAGAFRRARNIVSGIDLLAELDWPEPALKCHPRTGTRAEDVRKKGSWRATLHNLAQGAHWTPQQLGKLTLYHLRVYSMELDDKGNVKEASGGIATVSLEEARALARLKASQRAQAARDSANHVKPG